MPIVLRLIKGSELTFAELDGNFTDLDNRLDGIEQADLISRVTRLEQAGTPIYFDSDDVMVMLDSIWGGGVDSFLATTDSVGLASFNTNHFLVESGHVSIRLATYDSAGISSFDSNHFLVDSGHVSIKLATYDSAGIASFDSSDFNINAGHITLLNAGTALDSTGVASFDSSDFVVTNGHVTINPASAAGRVAGITPIDSTGLASFDSADFSVDSYGHVTLVGGGGTPIAFAGGGSMIMPANFTVNIGSGNGWSTQTYDPWETSRFPFIAGARYIGNFRLYHTWWNNDPGGPSGGTSTGYTGLNSTGGTGIQAQGGGGGAYTSVTIEDATVHAGGGDYIEFTAGTNCRIKVVAYNYWASYHNLGVQNNLSAARENNLFWYMRIG